MSKYIVFEQNNLGVASLMNGEMNRAFAHFRVAFDEARKNNRPVRQKRSRMGNNHTESIKSKGPLHWPLLSRQQVVETLKSAASNDARNHGFMISMNALTEGTSGTVDMTLASAFVVYNLGLVYSIGGSNGSNESLLLKSKMLFESCRRLLSACGSKRPSGTQMQHGNLLVDLLWLMTWTKLAEANHLLSDFKQARDYSIRLNSFVNSMRRSTNYRTVDLEVQRLVEDHCQRFLTMSSYFCELPSMAPAA